MPDPSDSSMPPQAEKPSSDGGHKSSRKTESKGGLFSWFKGRGKGRNGDSSARDTIEELLDEREERNAPLNPEEEKILKNIFGLQQQTVDDVSVPRADIIAVAVDTPMDEIISIMTREGHSRLPVHGEDLDDPIGMVHIKDILAHRETDEPFNLVSLCRKVLYVAPTMGILELLLEMRMTRTHMALVIDEYGGTDGLLTIEDLVEEIVGEIEDEHDRPEGPNLVTQEPGLIVADARTELEELEELIGPFAAEEEREDVDTLGGLVFFLIGRVPIRGEVISHSSGIEFEIIEADPRRIRRMKIRHGALQTAAKADAPAA